jgi:hypothetical protein
MPVDLLYDKPDEPYVRGGDDLFTGGSAQTVEVPFQPAAAPLSRDAARQQFTSALGGSLDDDAKNQFESIFNQSAEGGLFSGPGYNRPFADLMAEQVEQQKRRMQPTASNGGSGGDLDLNGDGQWDPGALQSISRAQAGAPRTTQPGMAMPGGQFDDPYTSLFENVAKTYLDRLTGPNPEFQRLMDFIGSQFGELSTSQGYSPDEQAILRTQALEPLERDRAAGQQRVLQRTAARGFLPSSGLNELDAREVDRDADTRRTVAQRDLAINAINKRQTDRSNALSLAQLGLNIPNQQGQQAMNVANSLYQLPRNSLMDSLAVLNASSPQSAISPLVQLQQQQQQQAMYDQQRTAQMWSSIGQMLAGLF